MSNVLESDYPGHRPPEAVWGFSQSQHLLNVFLPLEIIATIDKDQRLLDN